MSQSKMPARLGSKTPARPGSKTPARPGSNTPARPGSKTPARPGSKMPARPGSKTPARLGARTRSAPKTDVLSDILGLLSLRGEVLCWSSLWAPWGLRFKPDDALYFHVVERGRCLLRVDGAQEIIEAEAGDLVVLPESTGYDLLSSRTSRPVAIESLVPARAAIPGRLRYGGRGAETDILCARFRFDAVIRTAVLPGLPKVLHVKKRGATPEWLELTLRYLSNEAHQDAPGRDIALSRLVDLMFVQTLRHWLAETGEAPVAWLGAARDPRISKAIMMMHERPEKSWAVEGLAAAVGMSRTRFTDRFVELVGEPPAKYLTRWRMHHAKKLLQLPGSTIARIAEQVGYDSEAAFSRAFKRYARLSPAAFRTANTRR